MLKLAPGMATLSLVNRASPGLEREAIRLHAAIFGTLSVLVIYALTRLLWGHRPALIAAALDLETAEAGVVST